MRYFSPSIGDVKAYLTYYNQGIPDSLLIREKQGMGYYGLFNKNQQTHLTTCLTPKGGNIFKREEFLQVRYQSDIRPERFLPWVIGKVPLLDNRCLWIDMSLSGTEQNSPSSDYLTLEKAWVSWNDYWRSNFEQFRP
jgi:cyanosortase A-associated protein